MQVLKIVCMFIEIISGISAFRSLYVRGSISKEPRLSFLYNKGIGEACYRGNFYHEYSLPPLI